MNIRVSCVVCEKTKIENTNKLRRKFKVKELMKLREWKILSEALREERLEEGRRYL